MKEKYDNWQEYNARLLDLTVLTQDLRIERRKLFHEFKELSYEINNIKIFKDKFVSNYSEESYNIVWKNNSIALPKAEKELGFIQQEIDIIEEVILSIHKLQQNMVEYINSEDFNLENTDEQYDKIKSGEERVDISMKMSNNQPAFPELTEQEFLMEFDDFENYSDFENISWFKEISDNNN